MATKYLLSDAGGVYYTYTTGLINLGSALPTESTYTVQGFEDGVLSTLTNDSAYKLLVAPELHAYVADTNTALTVDVTPLPVASIQTTSRTSIDVHGYSGINSVTLNGVGGKYLVSFDNGVTWKSRESGTWVIVSADNVATQGMSLTAVNALTSAQWGEIFQHTQLDIIAYLGQDTLNTIPNMTSYTTPSGIAFASGNWAGKEVHRLFAIPPLNYMSNTPVSLPFYIGYVYPVAVVATEYSIEFAAANRAPTVYTFEGSNNTTTGLDGTWTLLSSDMSLTVHLSNTVAYKAYRLNITAKDAATSQFILNSFSIKNIVQHTLTSLSISLPANVGPAISNFQASTTSSHKENIVVSATLTDLEGDTMQYRVLLDAVVYQDWSVLAQGPTDVSLSIPYTDLTLSSPVTTHQIDLEARDSQGVTSSATPLIVTRVDTLPAITVVEAGVRRVKATIGDADNDTVRYRILLNEIEVLPWTGLVQAPVNVEYYVPRDMLIWEPYQSQNKVSIQYEDDLGQGGTEDIYFLATYTGLIFIDSSGTMLNDDKRNILLRPNLGTSTAGTYGEVVELKLKNQTGYPVHNLLISVDGATVANNTHVKLTSADNVVQEMDTLSSAELLNDGASMSFYIQPNSESTAQGGGTVKICAKAQIV